MTVISLTLQINLRQDLKKNQNCNIYLRFFFFYFFYYYDIIYFLKHEFQPEMRRLTSYVIMVTENICGYTDKLYNISFSIFSRWIDCILTPYFLDTWLVILITSFILLTLSLLNSNILSHINKLTRLSKDIIH